MEIRLKAKKSSNVFSEAIKDAQTTVLQRHVLVICLLTAQIMMPTGVLYCVSNFSRQIALVRMSSTSFQFILVRKHRMYSKIPECNQYQNVNIAFFFPTSAKLSFKRYDHHNLSLSVILTEAHQTYHLCRRKKFYLMVA